MAKWLMTFAPPSGISITGYGHHSLQCHRLELHGRPHSPQRVGYCNDSIMRAALNWGSLRYSVYMNAINFAVWMRLRTRAAGLEAQLQTTTRTEPIIGAVTRAEVIKESSSFTKQSIVRGGTGRDTDWFKDELAVIEHALLCVKHRSDEYGMPVSPTLLFHDGRSVGMQILAPARASL